ncbi:MAG: hypothetical protein H6Q89_4584 [Myxococcaceae bacterium]|nr:hypothetical protein [Myxococcaceae bacterium]
MKALGVLLVIAALGFGGYKLYQKRTATRVHGAFIYLVCSTEFLVEADPILKAVGGVSKNSTVQDALTMLQQVPAQGLVLADWVKANVPADKVATIASTSSLSKDQIGVMFERALKDAQVQCPDRMEGVNPMAVGVAFGTLVGIFKARGTQ